MPLSSRRCRRAARCYPDGAMTTGKPTLHSLAELHLYAALSRCRACSAQGLVVDAAVVTLTKERRALEAVAACGRCAAEVVLGFSTLTGASDCLDPTAAQRLPWIINPSGEPSELIDAAQWLILHRMAVETAARMPERDLARAILLEAGQCLAESLRFYPEDSDVPAESAFFTAESLQRFRDHPQLFARQRLIELAGVLPSSGVEPPVVVRVNRPAGTKWWLP